MIHKIWVEYTRYDEYTFLSEYTIIEIEEWDTTKRSTMHINDKNKQIICVE